MLKFTNNSYIEIFDNELPNHNFEELWNIHPVEHGQVIMYGKKIDVPRYQKSYGRDYNFTGMNHKAEVIPDEFKKFMDVVNGLYENYTFNSLLVNWYVDGNHYIGAHSDSTTQLVEDSPIVSISLGEIRKFRIKHKKTKEILKDIELKDKSIVAMCGKFQNELTHEIVKVAGDKGKKMGRRINLTFRVFQ